MPPCYAYTFFQCQLLTFFTSYLFCCNLFACCLSVASLDAFLIMMLLLLVHFHTSKQPSVSIKVQLASQSFISDYMSLISPQ